MNTYAVVGGTLYANRGAEAMVATTIGRVRDRDPDASFLLLTYTSGRDRRLLQDQAVEVIDASPKQVVIQFLFALPCWLLGLVRVRVPDAVLPRAVRRLRDCRALFDVSGISFHDGRLPEAIYNLMCVWPALLLRVPVVRLSQATGPFRNPLNRFAARWVTRCSLHTYARGRITADFVRELRVPDDRWSVAPDIAFAYRPTDSLTSENEDQVERVRARLAEVQAAGTDVVGVVPSSLVMQRMQAQGDDYVAVLQEFVRELNERGLHVIVMPHATRADADSLRNNDIGAVRALRDRLAPDGGSNGNAPGVSFVDFDLNTASIRSLVEQCSLLVTSRFHAMVAALALGVPVLVLGWGHKYEEVLEMFGVEQDAVEFSRAAAAMQPMIERCLADRVSSRERILQALPDVVAAAEAQFDVLDRLPQR